MPLRSLLPLASLAAQSLGQGRRIPLPVGWTYWPLNVKRPPPVLSFANQQLYILPVGGFAQSTYMGRPFGAFKESHFDDHVSPGVKKWHPGISVLVPK